MSSTDIMVASAGARLAMKQRNRRQGVLLWLVYGVAATALVLTLLPGIPSFTRGLIAIVLMVSLMIAGVPIAYAMIAAAIVGMIGLSGFKLANSAAALVTQSSVSSWTLSAIPLFVLLGVAMWRGGIAARAYTTARAWFGNVPGGLAVATNFAGATLATSSGSTIGITFALTRMAVPEMLKSGYSPRLATGAVAMAGTLGQIIPPSILLIIYAGVATVPVGPQLLAGVIPGIMLALAFALVAVLWALVSPSSAPRVKDPSMTWTRRLRALGNIAPIALIVGVVIGGIYAGVFTATESAAFGVLIAIVVGWICLGRGNRGLRRGIEFIRLSLRDTVGSVAALFIVVIGADLLTTLLSLTGVAQALSSYVADLGLGRVGLLLVLVVFYIVLGMFLESLPMILLTVPLLQGPLEAVGVDMIWFGIFIVIMCEIGMVFPPIGLLTFIVHRLAQDRDVNVGRRVGLSDVFRGVMPFVAATLAVVLIMIAWPDFVQLLTPPT